MPSALAHEPLCCLDKKNASIDCWHSGRHRLRSRVKNGRRKSDGCSHRTHLLYLSGAHPATIRDRVSHRQRGQDDIQQFCESQSALACREVTRSGMNSGGLGERHYCSAHRVLLEREFGMTNIGFSQAVSQFQDVLSAITEMNMTSTVILHWLKSEDCQKPGIASFTKHITFIPKGNWHTGLRTATVAPVSSTLPKDGFKPAPCERAFFSSVPRAIAATMSSP
jgi:hypothetical protein